MPTIFDSKELTKHHGSEDLDVSPPLHVVNARHFFGKKHPFPPKFMECINLQI
jgi:hypothetical protein